MAIINTEITYSKTLSYKEDVKGWVSFKSFTPEIANSMANDYYTFHLGELFIHHVEDVDRNTFYHEIDFPLGNFFASSVDVILNQNPSYVKEFNTLNYEGSQSKINKFKSELKILPFQPNVVYNDQKDYNLENKNGWYMDFVMTNKEDGYIDEFIEKEGKWFNYIKKDIGTDLQKADTADFSFQGIGFAKDTFSSTVKIPTQTTEITPEPTITTEIEIETKGEITTTAVKIDCYKCVNNSLVIDPNVAVLYDGNYVCPEGWNAQRPTCAQTTDPIRGCMNSESTNYNPLATIDDGSCFNLGNDACVTIAAGEGCTDWNMFQESGNVSSGQVFATELELAGHWAEYYNRLSFNITPAQMLLQFQNCCSTNVVNITTKPATITPLPKPTINPTNTQSTTTRTTY